MSGKIQVHANLQELCAAFEGTSIGNGYYLDHITSEILYISDYSEDIEELCGIEIGGLGKCYAPIPNIDSHVGYKDMEDFLETVKDSNLKEKLCTTINGKCAFRRFKDVLVSFPQERERWFEFKEAKTLEKVNEQLEEEGIEIIEAKPIEIRQISPKELSKSKEIEHEWMGFGAVGCLQCGKEDDFKTSYFIISRCPDSEEEQEWLDKTLQEQFGVEEYGIAVGIFGDEKGLIDSAVCGKCGSNDIFSDF